MRTLSHVGHSRTSRSTRGPRTNADWEKTYEQFAPILGPYLRLNPLREPVDARFKPYYERMLHGGRLDALLEYCRSCRWKELGASFYEFVGRLLPLQSVDAVKKVLSGFSRRSYLRGYFEEYERLLHLCKQARQFIEARYAAATQAKIKQYREYSGPREPTYRGAKRDRVRSLSDRELETKVLINREQLWRDYADKFFDPREGESGERLESLKEKVMAYADALPDIFSMDVVSRILHMSTLSSHCIVAKQMFFELSCHTTSADASERDRRVPVRHYRWKPSEVAQKFACALFDISPRTASHKQIVSK